MHIMSSHFVVLFTVTNYNSAVNTDLQQARQGVFKVTFFSNFRTCTSLLTCCFTEHTCSDRFLTACSYRWHGQHKTVLSCPHFVLSTSAVGTQVEMRQNCLVLCAVVFTPPMQTRQNCLVLSRVSGVKQR